MPSRRSFLAGLAAASVMPGRSWADVGAPDVVSAARTADGKYVLAGLTQAGQITFQVPLPDRGHAAAAHPTLPHAVAFARRPGNFAFVIACQSGAVLSRLLAPEGRHFYGHGCFSQDGALLFTSENDFEAAAGVIGLWDARNGYTRLGEFSSGGVGPHDVQLMPDGQTLVVANGGIETHPDMKRSKLNIPTMRPNLSYLSLDGEVLEQVELLPDLHKNSIRHLALADDGLVAFAMQWQGGGQSHPPLLGLHRRGHAPHLLQAPEAVHREMRGYAGSVALSRDGAHVAITSPRGNQLQIFKTQSAEFSGTTLAQDVCGVAALQHGFMYTTGAGVVSTVSGAVPHSPPRQNAAAPPSLAWDNHLIPVTPQVTSQG